MNKYFSDIEFHFKYALSWIPGGGGKFLCGHILQYINNAPFNYMTSTFGNEYFPIDQVEKDKFKDSKIFPVIGRPNLDDQPDNAKNSDWNAHEKFVWSDIEHFGLENFYDPENTNPNWVRQFKERLEILRNQDEHPILTSHFPLAVTILHTNITVDNYVHISNEGSWFPTLLLHLKELVGSGSAHILPIFYGYKTVFEDIDKNINILKTMCDNNHYLGQLLFSVDGGFRKVDHLEHRHEVDLEVGLENATLVAAYYMIWSYENGQDISNIQTFKNYIQHIFDTIMCTKKVDGNQIKPGVRTLRRRILYPKEHTQLYSEENLALQKKIDWEIEAFHHIKQKAIDLLGPIIQVIPYEKIFFDLEFPIKNIEQSIADYSFKNLELIRKFAYFLTDDNYKETIFSKLDRTQDRINSALSTKWKHPKHSTDDATNESSS